ncbi:hypothetical protein ACFYY8_18160 [Streptosporangium sp. NPDC001559]
MAFQPFGDGEQEGQRGGLAVLAQSHRAGGGDGHQQADTEPAV